MTSGKDPRDLHERWERALGTSWASTLRSARLVAESREVRVRSERVRLQSAAARQRVRRGPTQRGIQGFRVDGTVDGVAVVACMVGEQLESSPELLARARVVVAMGERFEHPDGGTTIDASLDGDVTASLLTVMRAFSTISSVEIAAGPLEWPGGDGRTDDSG